MKTEHTQMRQMLDTINQMRQDACERKTAEKLWRKSDVRAAILIAADSPELVRSGDAWRVYDFALSKQIVGEVKFVLRVLNPPAFAALCEYEGQEIEEAHAAEQLP
jgi:hypothetical protein